MQHALCTILHKGKVQFFRGNLMARAPTRETPISRCGAARMVIECIAAQLRLHFTALTTLGDKMKHNVQVALVAAACAVGTMGCVFGGEIALFETREKSDASTALRADVTDLAAYGAPTTIRAITVQAGNWELCSEREFRGRCRVVRPGDNFVSGPGGERIASVREIRYRSTEAVAVNAPPRIEIYPELDFRGAGMNVFTTNDSPRWGIRSMIIHAGTWEICSDYSARGRCQVFQPGEYRQLDGQLMSARSMRVIGGFGVQPVAPSTAARVDPIGAIAGAVIGGLIAGQAQGNPQVVGQPGVGNGRIHFFPGPGLTGRPLSVVGDVQNLRDFNFNDRTESIRVESGVWEVCTESGYRGGCRQLTPGDYPALYNSMLERNISSARMVQAPPQSVANPTQDGTYEGGAPETPHAVFLFADTDFRGETFRANRDLENMRNTALNDRTGSIFVRVGRWEFCTDSRFRGNCITLGPGSYGRLQYPMQGSISSFRRVQ
jgi:hypothetical protein